MNKINIAEQLDIIEEKVLSGLKDFQRATVYHIDKLYRKGQKRVLVSDEVGLGKTLIARGAIAKFAKMRKEENDDLVKVVYVCSNTSIAEQNLNKLRISRNLKIENSNSSRLSMQHLNIFYQENDEDLKRQYIQLIPLTPGTSFKIIGGAGTKEERALMFAILKRLTELKIYEDELEIIMRGEARISWGQWVKDCYENQVVECNKMSSGKYLKYMFSKLNVKLAKKTLNGDTLIDKIISICKEVKEKRHQDKNYYAEISLLRQTFAEISLDKLDPDFVIMDEFQRFKFLLNSDDDSETGMLAKKFFTSKNVRMLLLSATPYKMYSTLDEIEEAQNDEHYAEFLEVMKFLNIHEDKINGFKKVWENYSKKLNEFSHSSDSFLIAKNKAEEAMYENVCRTERISEPKNTDLIDDSDTKKLLKTTKKDIESFINAQKLLYEIDAGFKIPVDYIKSTPYIMSFMRDNYKYKRYIEKYFSNHPDEISKINKDTLWIKRDDIKHYRKISNNNARIDRATDFIFKDKSELLLWAPPSRPYYELKGVFENVSDFSKTLIFSSWEMVPRMIASLVSYEAERKTIGKLAANKNREISYFSTDDKKYPSSRLTFSLINDKPSAMTLISLIYPSQFLTNCYNPIKYINKNSNLQEIENDIKYKISKEINKFESIETNFVDKRWYYLAPLLFDEPEYVYKWFNDVLNANDNASESYIKHITTLKELYIDFKNNNQKFGKKPTDLVDILTNITIASPAVVINRVYAKLSNELVDFSKNLPTDIANIFISRMNTIEATAVVEMAYTGESKDAHWKKLLKYSKDGNLQSVFDEYAHLICNGLDMDDNLINNLHHSIKDSMDIRTSIYDIDTLNYFEQKIKLKNPDINIDKKPYDKLSPTSIRSHLAVAFTEGNQGDRDMTRKNTIRNAFNSPFRPFVLASTSIGQEGLDFHNYCRRIIHWNLPSNPIDLEQREGRINRFECLAIRQNIAKNYGYTQNEKEFKLDLWTEMFERAAKYETDNCDRVSDLIPHWGLTNKEDMVKIERIVPMYPFSRDVSSYKRLKEVLTTYRLTLGQPRQEELIETFMKNNHIDNISKYFMNLSPFYKNDKNIYD